MSPFPTRSYIAAIFLGVSAVAVPVGAVAEGRSVEEARRTVETVGRASVSVPPDRVHIEVTVEASGRSAKSAAELGEALSARLVNRLANLVHGGAVSSHSFGLRQAPSTTAGGRSEQFLATAVVEVVSERVGDAGKLIDAALAGGAREVRLVEFFVSDETPARRAAAEEAGRRAREKAEGIAQALGARLGPLLHADDREDEKPCRAPLARNEAPLGASALAPRGIEIGATVRARFEIR